MSQQSNGSDTEAGDALEAAASRLERALSLLASRVEALSGQANSSEGGLFDQDRSQLAAELDASRAREKELEAAGAEASQALGRAIHDIRRALERTEEA